MHLEVSPTLRFVPRILIANQDSFSRVYFRRAISRFVKAECHDVHNGLDALELLGLKHFHVLMLDLEIPGLSGLELLEFIHDDPEHKDLQVIVTTGIGSNETVRRAIALGVSSYVLKPYQQTRVEEQLAAALAKVQARTEEEDLSQSSSETRLLVADLDANFCDTVQSILPPAAEVKTVRSLPELLTASLRWKPHFLWVNPQVLGKKTDFVLQKITGLRSGGELIIHLISDGRKAEREPPPFGKGWIEKTFVPPELRNCCDQILRSSELFHDDLRTRFEEMQSEVLTAVRQVFGVMTGSEARPVSEEPELTVDLCASIDLDERDQGPHLRVVLQSTRALTVELCTQMTGNDAENTDEELIDSVLGEMLNMVAGRIKSCYSELRIELEMGLPQRNDPSCTRSVEWQLSHTHYFKWCNQPTFSLTILQKSIGEPAHNGPESSNAD